MSEVNPSNCPMHGIAPEIKGYYYGKSQIGYWNCRCLECKRQEVFASGKTQIEYSRFGYGACSSCSEATAIRNWNNMVKLYYARVIKDSVKVRIPRSLDEELKKTKLEQWQVNKVLKATKAYELLRAAAEKSEDKNMKEVLANIDEQWPEAECEPYHEK